MSTQAVDKDPWHYPRGELAAHILQALTLVDLIAIFAPRRKGKTWFVLRDLSPASIQRNYVPVYASLWQTPDKPHFAVIDALTRARALLAKRRLPWADYLTKLSSVSVNVAGLGGASVARSRRAEATADELGAMAARLAELVAEAGKRQRRVLLLIDEAQHLATSAVFDSTTKSLRTAIEGLRATRAGALKAVFTGSSRTDLTALLEHRNAAFYHSFDRQELPDLDSGYTDFVAEQLQRLGQLRVSREALWQTFGELHRSPYFMQALIRELMLKRETTLDGARNRVLQDLRDSPETAGRWAALKPLEKAIFRRVEAGVSLYSNEVMNTLAEATGRDAVTTGQVQNAMRQLTKKGYIGATRRRGEYRIEDPELKTWLDRQDAAAWE